LSSRSMHAKHGSFLDDIWTFDNAFFSISPREAKSMDPQQRILLHAVQQALDDAGYVADATPSFQRTSMACYVGLATGDYTDNLRDNIDTFYSTGNLSHPACIQLDTNPCTQEPYGLFTAEEFHTFTNLVGHV
jgi:acyl transferase domain-containing protein